MDVLNSAVAASVLNVVVAAAGAHSERGPVDGPPRGGSPALHLLNVVRARMYIRVSHQAVNHTTYPIDHTVPSLANGSPRTYLDGVKQALGVAPVQQVDDAAPRVRGQEDRVRGRVPRPLQARG